MSTDPFRHVLASLLLSAVLAGCATQPTQHANQPAATPPPSATAMAAPAPTITAESSRAASATAGECGGSERWPVKGGTDPQASQIDVSHPVETTIVKLNAIEPDRDVVDENDEFSRMPEEMTVYEIKGFLGFFKKESGSHGDQDYHLVITDQPGLFNQGGEDPTGHSLVAEIPHPDCYTGRHGNFPGDSAFDQQIKDVRNVFETVTAGVDGKHITPRSIPVTVTGVAFFDFDHGQIGRAKNVIELHPILNIEFTGTPPIS